MNTNIEARIKELNEKADNKELSNSVRYKARRDASILRLVGNLEPENGFNFDKEDNETFNRLMDPDVNEPIIVAEGDSLMKIMEENQDRRDVLAKVAKAAEKIGCKIDFAAGKIVKA